MRLISQGIQLRLSSGLFLLATLGGCELSDSTNCNEDPETGILICRGSGGGYYDYFPEQIPLGPRPGGGPTVRLGELFGP